MSNIIKMIVEKVKSNPDFEFSLGTIAIIAICIGLLVIMGIAKSMGIAY